MPHPFAPAVIGLLLPATYLGWRLGLLRRRPARAALAMLALCIAMWSASSGGLDYDRLKNIKLFLAAATGLLLLARGYSIVSERRTYRTGLIVLALASILVHTNFLSFHGTGQTREFVHLHDVAHYYLGSKYFRELAHADLYIAMLRAEADGFGPRAVTGMARDLRDNTLVDARVLLARSDPVKAGFTPTRWRDMQSDVAYFKTTMRAQYRNVLRDYGYNPTPVWTLIGGTLANLIPAGSNTWIRALTAIDPALELFMFGAIAWAFGAETALIALIYFCILFGASFGWLGGAFLRHLWLAALIGSACAMHRGRATIAGTLLALSTGLRAFPIFFAMGPFAKAMHNWRENQRLPKPLLRFAGGLVVGGGLLFAATTVTPRGLVSWAHFHTNMERHVENIAFNTIGLTRLADPFIDPPPAGGGRASTSTLDNVLVHRWQLITVFPLAMIWLIRRARRCGDLEAMTLGFVPLYTALDLACYYYVALMLLVLVNRDRLFNLALLFAVETASYSLRLFASDDATVFLYRNILVFVMLAILFFAPPQPTRSDASTT